MRKLLINCIWLLIFFCRVPAKVILKRLEGCSKGNSTKFYVNLTTLNGNQYVDMDLTLPRALDETVGCTVDVNTSLNGGKTFLPGFTVREKYFCKAANDYLGEFWYDLMRTAQATPKACPIPKRRYYVHHYMLDYNKMTVQIFQIGLIRTVTNVIDNNSKASLFCVLSEIDSV